ncbi:MAG: hypothetical protein RI931_511, partial [Actinomycetota bacterium]
MSASGTTKTARKRLTWLGIVVAALVALIGFGSVT